MRKHQAVEPRNTASFEPTSPSRAGRDGESLRASLDVTDRFEIGTPPPACRRQNDPEGVFEVDNEALRITPLLEPGWERARVSYGPFEREPGMAFAVFMLNGHNTAQSENLPERFTQRLDRWLLGSGDSSRRVRLQQWWSSGRRRRTLRLFRWWWHIRKGHKLPRIDENLAVGWFDCESPTDPVGDGNAFLMHATGADNGELWINVAGVGMPVIRGVRNLPLYFVIVLRPSGAAYYAATVPASRQLPGYGWLRPLAVDASTGGRQLHAVISQSTLGQIGFRIDSRIYATRITRIPAFSRWFGSAHAADALTYLRRLDDSPADVGGPWRVLSGSFECTLEGCIARTAHSLAVLTPAEATGLIHAHVHFPESGAGVALVWRLGDPQNFLRLEITTDGCVLREHGHGHVSELARSVTQAAVSDAAIAVQVLDDGSEVRCFVDGRLIIETVVPENGLNGRSLGLGAFGPGRSATVSHFEAHPRRVPLPEGLDLGGLTLPLGTRIVAHEKFEGPARPIEGKELTFGAQRWSRLLGSGSLDITGDGTARVRASAAAPNPGRTAFAFPWRDPQLADLELTATLPGTERGQRERARVGFIIWQDSDNYMMVNTWNSDGYDGGSISSFFHIDGFEDLYDAVWVNVGRALWWGRTIHLRLRFDGSQYLMELDGEPVLYRKLSDVYPHCERLKINKVGILLNWEWGDDTGTVIREFIARDGSAGDPQGSSDA